jgi:hypothetical protein
MFQPEFVEHKFLEPRAPHLYSSCVPILPIFHVYVDLTSSYQELQLEKNCLTDLHSNAQF